MKKILIIEDDQALAATIKNYFVLWGFEVEIAYNGALGIQTAFSWLPDVVVCDINIPVADGYQVFKILNEARQTEDIPFIFLTAKSSLEDIRTGMMLGADDYITKPFMLDELFKRVEIRLIKREKLLRQSESQFLNLLMSSPWPTFLCQNNRFVLVNDPMTTLLRYNAEELLMRNLTEFAEDPASLSASMSRLIALGEKRFSMQILLHDRFNQMHDLMLHAAFSFFRGQSCVVGNLLPIHHDQPLKEQNIESADISVLLKAIEVLDEKHHVIPVGLVNRLHRLFNATGQSQYSKQSEITLSDRELEVLQQVCLGKSAHEIASFLFISERTVEKHRAAILSKTGAHNMVEAVIFGLKNGLVNI